MENWKKENLTYVCTKCGKEIKKEKVEMSDNQPRDISAICENCRDKSV